MVDKEYYNDILLENKEYLELVEKYNTHSFTCNFIFIICKNRTFDNYFVQKK